jgi:sugar phosphate isomerase/epimerase
MKSAITLSLVPETRRGPFVYSGDLDEGFERAAKLGFDAVEIFLTSAQATEAHRLKELTQEHGLNISTFGTGAGWVKHKLRLTDPDANIRQRAREFIREMVDLAASFGAPVIIGSMQGNREGTVSREQAIAWLAEALEELGARAADQGVPLLYEFLNRYETNLFNRVAESLEFLRTLRTQNIKLLCDLFHMNIEEADVSAALRLAGPKLGHIHFADSNRQAVGFGHTDMKPIMVALRDIGYSGYLSAEVFPLPDGDTAAKQTIESFRKLAEKPNRPKT